MRRAITTVCLLLLLTACHPKPAQDRYPFHGTVISVEPRGRQALIKHDDVPGLMQGMTMPFTIKDNKTLASLKPGDILNATLVKQEFESWLENIKVTGSDPDFADDAKPATAAAFHRPAPGDPVPDFLFVNQLGKPMRFSQLRGAPVLLTFIYTRCPLPDFCPRMNANLLAVARQSKNSNLQLLSISFDPAHDKPSVLRNYARQWTDDLPADQRSRWLFVAPLPDQFQTVARFFALVAEPDQGWITHSLSTALVDAEGKIIRFYDGNQWTPDDVLKDLPPASGTPLPNQPPKRRAPTATR